MKKLIPKGQSSLKFFAPNMSDTQQSSSTYVARDAQPQIIFAPQHEPEATVVTSTNFWSQPSGHVEIPKEGWQDDGSYTMPDVEVKGDMPRSNMGIPTHVYHSDLSRRMYEDRNKAGRDIALGMAAVAAAPVVVPAVASTVLTAAPYVATAANVVGKVFTPSTYTNLLLPYLGTSAGTTALTGTLADAGWTGYWGYKSGKNIWNAAQHPENLTTFWDYAQLPLDVAATVAGAAGAKRAFNAGSQALRLSFYNHVTPLGYNTKPTPGRGRQIPVKEEIKRAIKGFFTEDVPIDPEYIPEWQRRVDVRDYAWSMQHNKGANLSPDAIIEFRKQAFRKGLRLPETKVNNIYSSNGDGTFRYDYDAISRINNRRANQYKAFLETNGRALDISTSNGAQIALRKLPNGQYEMYDKWDIQPFKDEYRSLNKFISKIPLVRNVEALHLLGGKPFVLKQTIEPEEIYTFMNLE